MLLNSRTLHPILVCFITTALLLSAFAVLQTYPARVSAGSCAEDAANLLKNGTMAGGAPNAYGVVAKRWQAFSVGATLPHFENALNEGYDPNGSQYIWRDLDAWDAGIFQKVKTLTPGETYHFWVVWGQALHDVNGSNARATQINRQIGVDTNGGTDPNAPNVIWSAPYFGGGGFNRPEWHLHFTAAGATATFFLRAQNGHTDGRNKVFFDTACLYPAGGAPTSTPWSPTPSATQTFSPTPTQTPVPGAKIDDADPSIAYGGAWTQGADARALNGTYHYARGVKGAPVIVTYNFTGTQVTIWYIGYKNRGRAKILIDGVKIGVIDQYTPGVAFDLSRTFFNLAPGAHQLKIKNAGAKNPAATDSIITLDAIEVPNATAHANVDTSYAFQFVGQRMTRAPMPSTTPVPPRYIKFKRAAPLAPTPEDPSVIWDARLPGLNVSLATATVAPGALYWKLIRADYHDPFQHGGVFGGDHNMYYVISDELGARVPNHKVWQSWPDDKTSALTNTDGIADIAMWANYFPENGPGPYNGYVDGLPSDEVRGMGLPANNHVSFVLYFQKTVKGDSGVTPTVTLTFTPTDAPPTVTESPSPTLTPTPTDNAPPTATVTPSPTNEIPGTPTATPTVPPATPLVDDAAAEIAYSASWTQGADARALNGTYHHARGAKRAPVSLTYKFTGTRVTVWHIGYKNRGKAVVKIDGIKVGVIDQYRKTLKFGLSANFGNLAPGAHTLKIINKGAKNPNAVDSIIVLDALEITP